MQHIHRVTIRLIAVAALLITTTCALLAQTATGSISGIVTDPTGAVVSGAQVTITNEETGVTRTLTTNGGGFYSAENLSVGRYKANISKSGFEHAVIQGMQIDPGQRRTNNVTLKLGSATSSVTVSADAEQINTQTSDSGGTLSSKQISNLMLNGRNFQTLAIAVPGVSSTKGADALGGGGLLGGTTLIVNGNSVEYSTYTIDGIYNMNSGNMANIDILPVVDGISEFTVLKDSYSAKYGFAGSGQIVVVTKSGTDTFHGSAWDYLRNNAFDANNYFSTTSQALHQNIYGYTLGGPVIIPKIYNTDRSKKTFFFASNQWQAISAGQVSRAAVFPQAMRNGDFSNSPTLSPEPPPIPPGTTNPPQLMIDPGSQALLATRGLTPSTCLSAGSDGRMTQINPTCMDPIAVGLLNAYVPLPNNVSGGFQNYINQNPLTTSQLDYQFRVDHQINQNNEFTARILYEPIKNGFPYDNWGGTPYTTITDSYYTTGFNGLVRVQSEITPNLMNIASVAYVDDRPHILLTKGGQMPEGLSVIQSFPNAPVNGRIPNISISEGWAGNGVGSQPISASDGEGLIMDDVNWVRGGHVLQAGALYMYGIKRQTVFTNPQGSFSFSGVHTGDPAADYMLGLDSSYSQASTEREGAFHYRQGEAYVQDDWHVTSRLTLNLGVRWVYFSNDTVSGDQVSNFDSRLYQAAQAPVVNPNGSFQLNSLNQPLNASGEPADLLNGLAFAGQNGVSSGFFTPVKTNFGPRVGFAYDVSGNGTTSLRGGYGIGYSRIPTAQIYYAFGQNPPYNQSANILNSLLSNGTAGGTAVAPTPQNLNNVPFFFTPSQIQSYSLTLEHQVNRNAVGAVAYVGSQSRHLASGIGGGNDINFPLPVSVPSVSGCLAPGQAASATYDFDPCINSGISSANYTRPYLGYSTINQQYDGGSANYNALQSSVSYRAGSSQFSLAYTWSKTLATVAGHGAGATTSQGSGPQNPRDWQAEYGPPSYDFTNDITGTWVYAIPYSGHGNKLVGLTLGHWSFQGLVLHQSGFALSPGMSTSTNGEATRPDVVGQNGRVGRLNEWFNTSAFAAPDYGFFGDASNGTIRGPGYTSLNVSLYKAFPIHDRFTTEIRAEAFNVLNHPNFNNVDTGLGDGSYGQVNGAGDPRIMEFAMKLSF